MPFLPSSGPLSINDIRNMFGGPSSPSMANYYRGGAYIPAQKTVTVVERDPPSGEYYSIGPSAFRQYWYTVGNGNQQPVSSPFQGTAWFGTTSWNVSPPSATSTTIGDGWTYFRGTNYSNSFDSYTNYSSSLYGIFRTRSTTTTVNINTNIPTSGQISMNQFYGAEKP